MEQQFEGHKDNSDDQADEQTQGHSTCHASTGSHVNTLFIYLHLSSTQAEN